LEGAVVLELVGCFAEVEAEVFVCAGDEKTLIDSHLIIDKPPEGLQLGPGQNGSISGDRKIVIIKIGGPPGERVKGEVVAILQIVVNKLQILRVDDGVDEVKVEGELAVVLQEEGEVAAGFAGGVGEERGLGAFAYYDLGEFEVGGTVFALEGDVGAGGGAEPLGEGLGFVG